MKPTKEGTSYSPTRYINIPSQAFALLKELTKTGLYGHSVSETTTILLLEKLREISANQKP